MAKITPEEIKALVGAKIKGQGTAVDMGSALPTILNGIVDLIPSLEDIGITFGGLLQDGDNIPTTPNRFYLTTDYGEFYFGDDAIEIDEPAMLTAFIVDKDGNLTTQNTPMFGVNEVDAENPSPVSSEAVYGALHTLIIDMPDPGNLMNTGIPKAKVNDILAIKVGTTLYVRWPHGTIDSLAEAGPIGNLDYGVAHCALFVASDDPAACDIIGLGTYNNSQTLYAANTIM